MSLLFWFFLNFFVAFVSREEKALRNKPFPGNRYGNGLDMKQEQKLQQGPYAYKDIAAVLLSLLAILHF